MAQRPRGCNHAGSNPRPKERRPDPTASPDPRNGALTELRAPATSSGRPDRRATRPALAGGWLRVAAWVGVGLAVLAVWIALTWPLALHLDRIWTMAGDDASRDEPNFVTRPGTLASGDALQNMFIDVVVADNVAALREPYLDLREGAAGPAPLRTTSLNVPWMPVVALLRPLVGLVAAYNATLLLSSLAAGLAAFGLCRRHTRWPLLAAAGAVAYACSPNRMFQLTSHFNAVMWWAFPAALWALEAMLERHRERRPWGWPAVALAAVVGTVGLSGEYHLNLYLTVILTFLAAWAVAAALAARRPLPLTPGSPAPVPPALVPPAPARRRPLPPVPVPLAPAAAVLAMVAAAAVYVLVAFAHAFQGTVAGGENGSYDQVMLYAPGSLAAMVTKSFGTQGEGMIYVGWGVLVPAAAGFVAALARRSARRRALPYALLAPALVVLTYGPRAEVGRFRPYRFLFDHVPPLSLQRVPERLMVVTALVLVVLAVEGLDALAGRLAGGLGRRLAAAGLALAVALLVADYRISANRLQPSLTGNRAVAELRRAGDRAGPILGLPVVAPTVTWNSATTYLAAQSGRRALNAYNQTPAPWLADRLATLAPLNDGKAAAAALAVLSATGTRQVVVIDEPRVFAPGRWRATIDALVASGRFRPVVDDPPLALLELVS